ncbi:MAG: hypothetical protein Q9P01_18870 [Anaerolineae bacterium]|nr:hypothetical protein [Anaerolineae bacterium]
MARVASGSSELSVLNTGNETQRLSIRVSGMPSEWLRLYSLRD